ncbi:hypothetical protein LX32DRAFT_727182 [Colletotrichum zoysiae]|uniref:Uncharacterized protein n=1 Tax=Colletotrichum zoysiae TaxID=1216348 RepID=A0AAD9M3J4_9PEZI|nr:hypothetical protein LX32DRAFT_727182 [Colletotrichum zoysiae]
MSANQEPGGGDTGYSPSVFSQDTAVGSDANSLHSLVRNADDDGGPPSRTLRGTDRQPTPADNFHYVSTRVVKEMPRAKAPTDPESRLGKLKNLLKPPVVKAVEALPSHEGKAYHVDERGQVIETTTRRAGECRRGTMNNRWAAGAGGGDGGA